MTVEAFLRQYHATGQEKGDGYFPIHFEGMAPGDLARARAMMLARALEGDTVDLDGLRLVGDASTVAELERAAPLDARHGLAFEAARRETLFTLTGDARHLWPLLRWLDVPEREPAAFAAEALARHPLPAPFRAPLAERLADGAHEAVAGPVLDAWLAASGIAAWDMAVYQRELPFIRRVLAVAPGGRPALLAERD